jgi:hypothetical protein
MIKRFILISFFLPSLAFATHLKCGHISLKKISGLKFLVTINVYTNTRSPVKVSDGKLNFGDGVIHTTPTQENTVFATGIGFVSYSIEHTYQKPGQYTISYIENNLESGSLNIANSENTPFYLETSAYLDETTDYSSPNFLSPPIFYLPLGLPLSFSNAAYDNNNYRLVYHLTSPIRYGKYTQPESLKINNYNGTVIWDGKYQGQRLVGTFLFALKVLQVDEMGNIKGSMTRTFQIIVEDVYNNNDVNLKSPSLDENSRVFVDVGQRENFLFEVSFNEYQSEVDGDIYFDQKIQPNITWSKYKSYGFFNATLQIKPTEDIVRDNPYPIVLRLKYKLNYINNNYYYRDVPLLLFTKDVPLPPVVAPTPEKGIEGVIVSPNPCVDQLSIYSEFDGEVEIIDMAGRTVENFKTLSPVIDLDLSRHPTGTYFLNYRDTTQKKTFRILKYNLR